MHIPYDLHGENNSDVHRHDQVVRNGIPHISTLEPVVLVENAELPDGENGMVDKLPSLFSSNHFHLNCTWSMNFLRAYTFDRGSSTHDEQDEGCTVSLIIEIGAREPLAADLQEILHNRNKDCNKRSGQHERPEQNSLSEILPSTRELRRIFRNIHHVGSENRERGAECNVKGKIWLINSFCHLTSLV